MKRDDFNVDMTLVALTQHLCPKCRFVSSRGDLTNIDVACEKCGTKGTRQMYPEISAITLTGMAKRYFARATAERQERRKDLQLAIAKIAGRDIPIDKILLLNEVLKKEYQLRLSGQIDMAQIYKFISDVLDVRDSEKAMSLFVEFIGHSDTTDDDKTVVVLTITLLERMLDDLLLEVMLRAGRAYDAAQDEIDQIRSFERKRDKFKEVTGLSFAEVMKAKFEDLYQGWTNLADVRHKFIHGNPYAIGVKDAEKADRLLDSVFAAFAYTHNFCYATPLAAPPKPCRLGKFAFFRWLCYTICGHKVSPLTEWR